MLVLRDPSVPIVALRATWVGGLRYETARDNGISNLVASLLTRGTTSRTAEEIMHEVEGMAGSLSGYRRPQQPGPAGRVPGPPLPEGLDLVADCLLNATFPEAEIDHERRLVLEDIRAQDDNLTHVAFRAFHEAMWTRHPYRLDPLGTAALDAGRWTAGSCSPSTAATTGPAALTLAVVGDVDPGDVLAACGPLFDARPADGAARSPPRRAPAAEPAVTAPRQVVRYLSREQAHLVLGFPGVTLDARIASRSSCCRRCCPGRAAACSSRSARSAALAYRVSAFSLEGLDPGYFAVYVGTSPENVDEVLAQRPRRAAHGCQRRASARRSWRARSAT